jgi:CheY-like chemotaxis protein
VRALVGRRIRDLQIEVRRDGVVLRGRANSYHAKQLAQHALMAVTDLPLASNAIEVACLRRDLPGHTGQVEESGIPSPMKPCVLIASGDDHLRSSGHNYLTHHGYFVFVAKSGVECMTSLREFNPDVIVLDTDLLWGGADGVLALIRSRNNTRIPVVLLICRDAISRRGVSRIAPPVVSGLEKPVALESLLEAVRFAAGGDDATSPSA